MSGQDFSQRPYLVRAMHEWMTDSGKTPHLVVDAKAAGVRVPLEYVEDGRIVLNCSYSATSNLVMGNEEIEFGARFGGTPHLISVPIDAVMGIYSKESGEGMLFAEEHEDSSAEPLAAGPDTNDGSDDGSNPPEPPPSGSPGRSHLRVIK